MEPMGIERHRWASPEAEVSGTERVNTALSGSGRVEDIEGHPQGEIRGPTKLVKPEMPCEPIRYPVGVYPSWSPWRPRRAIRNRLEALQVGLEQKSEEFKQTGAEVYAKA